MIVICSPAAAESRWVNAVIEAFRSDDQGSVLCLLAGGTPDAARGCWPPALTGTEPLAADLANDGRRLAKLKLIAALLQVGLDELVQRDVHRRQRRLSLVAAASVAGMVLTSALAFYAVRAQTRAENEARIAGELRSFCSACSTPPIRQTRGVQTSLHASSSHAARRA